MPRTAGWPRRHRLAETGLSATSIPLRLPPETYTLTEHPTDPSPPSKNTLKCSRTGPLSRRRDSSLQGQALADAKLVRYVHISPRWRRYRESRILHRQYQPTHPRQSHPHVRLRQAPHTPRSRPRKSPPPPTRGAASIPFVVLSPSPSSESSAGSPANDITVTLDAEGGGLPAEETSAYHVALAEPVFWEKFMVFLNESFPSPADAERAWEDLLRASKNTLTASEVARIRDHVGVSGMAGT
ncbi:hypothetical protein C8R47DRAFT_117503 [Mycena vitilis]|nr:hypothetical protein C8R47DRAFT_117503 [Mycena vitilis]